MTPREAKDRGRVAMANSARALAFASIAACCVPACADQGQGEVTGTVEIPACRLSGPYDLHASFYGADRYNDTAFSVRIQDGGGSEYYSNSLHFEFENTEAIHRLLLASTDTDAQGHRQVRLPVGPQGMSNTLVHATFSPNQSCAPVRVDHLASLVGLWAYEGYIVVRSIDRGVRYATSSAETFTDIPDFDIKFHDPRPIGEPGPSGVDPNTPVGDAELRGYFRFAYTRASPGQYFP